MRPLLLMLLFLLSALCAALPAWGACSSPAGKTYAINGYRAVFIQGPFGPGESGIVKIYPGDIEYGYECLDKDKCLISVTEDGSPILWLYQTGADMLVLECPPLRGE